MYNHITAKNFPLSQPRPQLCLSLFYYEKHPHYNLFHVVCISSYLYFRRAPLPSRTGKRGGAELSGYVRMRYAPAARFENRCKARGSRHVFGALASSSSSTSISFSSGIEVMSKFSSLHKIHMQFFRYGRGLAGDQLLSYKNLVSNSFA